MGYGPVINGKQKPITPFYRSWACEETQRKQGCKHCYYYQERQCPLFSKENK